MAHPSSSLEAAEHMQHSACLGMGHHAESCCTLIDRLHVASGDSEDAKAAHTFLQRTLYRINRLVLFW